MSSNLHVSGTNADPSLSKENAVIDLYTCPTPNGRKVSILLDELGIEYRVHAFDISKGDQFTAEFLQIAPNNRIPVLVAHETGIQLMESVAIMLYQADKFKRFH